MFCGIVGKHDVLAISALCVIRKHWMVHMIKGDCIMKRNVILVAIGLVAVAGLNTVQAVTVSDITTALSDNYAAITDITADLVVDSSNNNYDVTNGKYRSKGNASTLKFLVDITSPESGLVVCNGTTVDIDVNQWPREQFVTTDNGMIDWASRYFRELDVVYLLNNYGFSLDSGTYSASGVTCYRISSNRCRLLVDVNNYKKLMRVEWLGNDGSLQRTYDLSGHSFIESTAYVAQYIDAVYCGSGNAPTYSIELSNISINDNLNDSVFNLP